MAVKNQADPNHRPQFGLINLLKAGAAQLIVLHHLAFYGPMSDYVQPMWPALLDWLGDSARIAVQVFLVIGGFLAAKSLSPDSTAASAVSPGAAIGRRYAKLAPPFIAATLLAVLANVLAGLAMEHDSISAPAGIGQLLAHGLLLHGVLGYESLSAGAWYVAIDFQLYAASVIIVWSAGRLAGARQQAMLLPLLVAAGMTLSLFYFNLDSSWDNWAPYFFGSYGLGMLAWWASDPRRQSSAVSALVLLMLVPTTLALSMEFRSRIALALATACVLCLCGRSATATQGRAWSSVHALGRISYGVFLIHFPVCLLVNAAFVSYAPLEPAWQALGMLCAWMASLAAGAAFHRWIEVPLGRAVRFTMAHLVMRPVLQ